MKTKVLLLSFSLLVTACGGGGSQVLDHSLVCDSPQEAAEFEGNLNGNTVELMLPGGVPAILKQTPGNPVVAVRLFVRGGAGNLAPETSGIEAFSLDVATEGGSEAVARADFQATLDSMGSAIGASTALDYSTLSMNSLTAYLDDTWGLYRQVFRTPAFPEEEIERLRQQHVQSLLMRQENPDDQVVDLARGLIFEGHPYSNQPRGTVENLERFTRDELMAYYQNMWDPSRMLLVVVGDLDSDQLLELVGDTFETGRESGVPLLPPAPLETRPSRMSAESASIPTNYIIGLAPAPNPTDSDYPAMVLAVNYLSDRLFEEVRTARNLTYAVSANMGSRLANYAYFYVTATDPGATIPVIFDEIRALQNEPLVDRDLSDQIAVFITSYYTGLDSNGAVASELGWWELFGGGREHADSYVSRLRAATPEEVQRVAADYLSGFQVGVVGDPEQVNEALFSDN